MKHRLMALLVLSLGIQIPSAYAAEQKMVKFEGYVEWRNDELFIVDGQRVRVTDTTKVKLLGPVTSLVDVPLGYEVKGEGFREAGGVLRAKKIELKPNGSALFESEVASMFDEVEREYLRRGRVFDADEEDNIVADYGRLIESGPEIDRVRRIATNLIPPYLEAEDFRFYVVDNSDWNAMAAPNRSINVFAGLLEALDDDELAILLGHELAHATHEHSRRQYKRSFITELVTMLPLAVAESHIGSGVGRMFFQLGTSFGLAAWENRYSRKQEDQADRVGLRYAHEAGYDVSKGPHLWLCFAEKYGNDIRALNFFFGSHSSSLDRAKKLEREIAVNYSLEAASASLH